MSAIRLHYLTALSLAAAVALTTASSNAGNPQGPKNGNGGQGSGTGQAQAFKPAGMNPGQGPKVGGGLKIDLGFNQGPKNGGIKIDPQFGQGPKNGGIKIDPGIGNGKGPNNGGGIKIDPGIGNGKGPNNGPKGPGFGNGMGMKPNKPGDKPWWQKPGVGKPNTIFCKTPCDPNYCYKYGMKKSFGYCYKGYEHCHWYCQKWSHLHNCWFFYDPCCSLWYYWCEPDLCYYPCTYLPYKTYVYVAPAPVVVATPVVVAHPVVTPVVVTPPVVPTTTTTTETTATSVGGPSVVAAGGVPTQPVVANQAPINLPPLPGEK